jgi:hypothetical protein
MVSLQGASQTSCSFSGWDWEPKDKVFAVLAIAALAINLVGIVFSFGIRNLAPEYSPLARAVLLTTTSFSAFLLSVLEKLRP